jgi:hypothetical protein
MEGGLDSRWRREEFSTEVAEGRRGHGEEMKWKSGRVEEWKSLSYWIGARWG